MLLVGVVADTSGPSGKVLKKFNVTLKETRKTMEATAKTTERDVDRRLMSSLWAKK